MSNVNLDKLSTLVPPRDRNTPSLELIDLRIESPTFGDHLQRAATPPNDADGDVADEAPVQNDPADIKDVQEHNTNDEQNDPSADSDATSEEIEDRGDGGEGEETDGTAISENGQDVESEEENVEEVAQRRASDGSPKQGTKQIPRQTAPGETGSTEGASPNTKTVATEQSLIDPSTAATSEDDVELSATVDDSVDDESKKRPAGDAILQDSNLKDRGVAATDSSNATKAAEVNQSAVSPESGAGDSEGDRESEPREGRHARRAKHSQSKQSRAPFTTPAEQTAAGSASLEKSPAVAEAEQAIARATAKDTTTNGTPVRVGGQPSSAPTPEATAAPAGDLRVSSSFDPIAETQALRDSSSNSAERVRFVQRVARAFQVAGERGGQITLRLNPPELGSVRLDITIRNGVLRAHLEAETPAARQALLENLPALRERLAEQDVKIEQFDVDLRDEERGGANDKRAGDRENRNDNRANEERAEETSAINAEQESTSEPTVVTEDGGLNVVI